MKDYKYNLNRLIMETERGLSISAIENMLLENYGIPAPTFRKDRAIEKGSSKSIKDDRLASYAAFFNTTTDKLRNYELSAGKSLKQLKSQTARDTRESVSDSLGLKKRA